MVGMQGVNREGTHNYRPRENGVAVASWTETYRLCVIIHSGVGPDEVHHGGIPILRDRQVYHN